MNSLVITLVTSAAEGITGLLVTVGAKGVAATMESRAKAYLGVATVIADVEADNVTAAISAITGVINVANLDPGEGLALSGLLTTLVNKAGALQSLLGDTITGTMITTLLGAISTGITNAANAELAKYAPKAA